MEVTDIFQLFADPAQALAGFKIINLVVTFMGFAIVVGAIFAASKKGGDGGREEWTGIIVSFLVGCLLIGSPELHDILTEAFFGVATDQDAFKSITSYATNAAATKVDPATAASQATYRGAMFLCFLIGWIAFIRGILIIKSVGSGQSNASYGQAAVFIVAGILATNMPAVLQFFGLTLTL